MSIETTLNASCRNRILSGLPAPYDNVLIDPREPKGIIIVGEAQAGKTTLKDGISRSWETGFDNQGRVLHFSNSAGFRGYAAEAIYQFGLNPDEVVADTDSFVQEAATYLNELSEYDREAMLDAFYISPKPKSVLRSAAVESAVAQISEKPTIRPHMNSAGSRYMRRVMETPSLAGLPVSPGLVVIDGRNQDECLQKFAGATVRPIGTFVLTCPPEVIAKERLLQHGTQAEQNDMAARLARRNDDDRRRAIGKMTIPADLSQQFVLDRMFTRAGNPRELALLQAGSVMASDKHAGAVIRTDRITLENESMAVTLVMYGMLHASQPA